MKVKPLGESLLLKINKKPEKTDFGVILPIDNDTKLEEAVVLAVGPEVEEVKKGDTVIFKAFNLDIVECRNETLNFIKQGDILAVVELK